MRKRLLIIDDEPHWVANFKRWIPKELAEQHSATTPQEAVCRLRRFYYDLVLLDLSMSSDPGDRSNQAIQEYLSTQPDGTNYIIVSGTASKAEVRDAAYALNAYWVVFKQELDPVALCQKIAGALEGRQLIERRLIADARVQLVGDVIRETKIIESINIGGAARLGQMLDRFLNNFAPLARHKFRPTLSIYGQSVVGAFWSRRFGQAISVSIANANTSDERKNIDLAEWLGYQDRGSMLEKKTYFKKVSLRCFSEPNISEECFDLPEVRLS